MFATQTFPVKALVSRLEQVVAQARLRLSGEMPEGATRLVSLHDPDARPIKKGRIGKPVEFGYVGQVVDNEDGVVVDHSLHMGNPFDGLLLAPALRRVTSLARRAPRAVTADRGYGDAKVDKDLTELGVSFVAIIRKGRQSTARRNLERSPRFRDLVKWRTGSEGRISALKRSWGWSKPDGRARRRQGLVRLRHLRQQQPENWRAHRREAATWPASWPTTSCWCQPSSGAKATTRPTRRRMNPPPQLLQSRPSSHQQGWKGRRRSKTGRGQKPP